FMQSFTCSGSGVVLMTLARTLVPPQSMTDATNGTGMPGAAIDTIVNARSTPSLSIGTLWNPVAPHDAHALRRSKYRAPHEVHSFASRCGCSPNTRYSTNGICLPTPSLLGARHDGACVV